MKMLMQFMVGLMLMGLTFLFIVMLWDSVKHKFSFSNIGSLRGIVVEFLLVIICLITTVYYWLYLGPY